MYVQNHDYEALELVEENLAAAGVRLLKDEESVVDIPGTLPCFASSVYWCLVPSFLILSVCDVVRPSVCIIVRAYVEVGPVQIIGTEFYFHDAQQRLLATLAQYPRRPGHLRLLLLHHPSHFLLIPDGQADLVLSGHHVRTLRSFRLFIACNILVVLSGCDLRCASLLLSDTASLCQQHGGQIGLLSLGLQWTLLRTFRPLTGLAPDHGLWGHGTVRGYAHRGTGHYGVHGDTDIHTHTCQCSQTLHIQYSCACMLLQTCLVTDGVYVCVCVCMCALRAGFPLRVGVPSEQSLLHVHYKVD